MSDKILLIDDDENWPELVREFLTSHGYELDLAWTSREALELAKTGHYALILLDLKLGHKSGLDIFKMLRLYPATKHVPIFMLTANEDAGAAKYVLSSGNSEFIVKSSNLKLLEVRIAAKLNQARLEKNGDGVLAIGYVTLHPSRLLEISDISAIQLTRTEFSIVRPIMVKRGDIATRQELILKCWRIRQNHDAYPRFDHNLNARIAILHRKLGDFKELIKTVAYDGYRFDTKLSEDLASPKR
ncbi:MAG: response regulator transcription factor [Elusimicrobia bacterium]|nr:response regulator transcription factor [Elusimicrobiota bacterium]